MLETISLLVLDFNRPKEAEVLLRSLQRNANFNKRITYLCNGGSSQYAYDFYLQGLIDDLIIKKENDGGGFGQTDLFKFCKTKYAIFIQVDQYLGYPLYQHHINDFIARMLEDTTIKCIDLNGDQSRRKVWTDRAHFIDAEFFNSLSPFPNGGPGPYHHLPWNEKYLQDKFIENNYNILHVNPAIFLDNGKHSIRDYPCGGQADLTTDEKKLYIFKPIREKYVFPDLTDEEWDLVLNNKWINGTIPENYKDSSLVCWKE